MDTAGLLSGTELDSRVGSPESGFLVFFPEAVCFFRDCLTRMRTLSVAALWSSRCCAGTRSRHIQATRVCADIPSLCLSSGHGEDTLEEAHVYGR